MGELRELTGLQCLELLAHHSVGRIAVVIDDGVVVVPVNYGMENGCVVFRTHAGPMLNALTSGEVSFQLDQIDPFAHTGWSVLVQGIAQELPADARTVRVEPWADGERDHWLRVVPRSITGRRIELAPLVFDGRGYT